MDIPLSTACSARHNLCGINYGETDILVLTQSEVLVTLFTTDQEDRCQDVLLAIQLVPRIIIIISLFCILFQSTYVSLNSALCPYPSSHLFASAKQILKIHENSFDIFSVTSALVPLSGSILLRYGKALVPSIPAESTTSITITFMVLLLT